MLFLSERLRSSVIKLASFLQRCSLGIINLEARSSRRGKSYSPGSKFGEKIYKSPRNQPFELNIQHQSPPIQSNPAPSIIFMFSNRDSFQPPFKSQIGSNNATMRHSALIGLLPLLAALTIAAPVINGDWAPLAGWTDADSASVWTANEVGPLLSLYIEGFY